MPVSAFYGEFLDTVGMEYEGIGLSKKFMESQFLSHLQNYYPEVSRKITITRDASTEFRASAINYGGNLIWLSDHTREASNDYFSGRKVTSDVMGYEIITHPLTIPDLERLMYPLITSVVQFGDFISDRAAIHFHVGFCNNLRFLKNILAVGLYIDPVLFRLGGMGRTFRGKINNSAYARPLLNSVAAYTPTTKDGNFVRAINPKAALEAKTMEEFWSCFGVKYGLGGVGKYHPSRYCGLNFYSIPQHGTIEWRHTNQTHDVYMLMAIGKFLRGITELSVYMNPREVARLDIVPSNDEISASDGLQILTHLYTLCREKDLQNLPSEEEFADICSLFEKSHFQKIDETPVLTHLTSENSNVISREIAERGKLEYFKKVIPPNHVDIHTIGYISLYDRINFASPPRPNNMEESEEEQYEEEEQEN